LNLFKDYVAIYGVMTAYTSKNAYDSVKIIKHIGLMTPRLWCHILLTLLLKSVFIGHWLERKIFNQVLMAIQG